MRYRVTTTNGEVVGDRQPVEDCRPPGEIEEIEEPIITRMIIDRRRISSAPILKLCEEKRGVQKDFEYLDARTACMLTYELPLNEIVLDFYDRLKSRLPRLRLAGLRLVGYQALPTW